MLRPAPTDSPLGAELHESGTCWEVRDHPFVCASKNIKKHHEFQYVK